MTGTRGGRDPCMPLFNPVFAATLRTRLRQAVHDYVARGRRFAGLDDATLDQRFLLSHKAWCRYPYHREMAREINGISSEYLARGRDAPFRPLLDDLAIILPGWNSLDGVSAALDREPVVTIVVMLDPLGVVLFAAFLGALLGPRSDRYGRWWLRGPDGQNAADNGDRGASSPDLSAEPPPELRPEPSEEPAEPPSRRPGHSRPIRAA